VLSRFPTPETAYIVAAPNASAVAGDRPCVNLHALRGCARAKKPQRAKAEMRWFEEEAAAKKAYRRSRGHEDRKSASENQADMGTRLSE
jgi:hypothetical protein